MNKKNTIIFWTATGLLCALVGASAFGYILNFDGVSEIFQSLGYPTFVIIPLAIAKIMAIVAIASNQVKWLKEWAYAGLFFDFMLALQAHIVADDHEWLGAVIATALLAVSYIYDKKVRI